MAPTKAAPPPYQHQDFPKHVYTVHPVTGAVTTHVMADQDALDALTKKVKGGVFATPADVPGADAGDDPADRESKLLDMIEKLQAENEALKSQALQTDTVSEDTPADPPPPVRGRGKRAQVPA